MIHTLIILEASICFVNNGCTYCNFIIGETLWSFTYDSNAFKVANFFSQGNKNKLGDKKKLGSK
jgi:hypothetical protein